MGSGSWSSRDFTSYSCSTKASLGSYDSTTGSFEYNSGVSARQIYKSSYLDPDLNPLNVIRECVDTKEHPNTIPVALCLDCSGSMGSAAVEVSSKLNVVMTELYKKYKDIEFMVIGIGDLDYDDAPIQVTQFESDIRIAKQLDKVYFEFGGGGNRYESYTAAWYFGCRHTKLDCWKRNKKGIIITMGDENLNPYLPKSELKKVTGDTLQSDIYTTTLYEEAKNKFDIYHINVEHGSHGCPADENLESFGKIIGKENVANCSVNNVSDKIIEFINKSIDSQSLTTTNVDNDTVTEPVDWTVSDNNETSTTSEGSALFSQEIDW